MTPSSTSAPMSPLRQAGCQSHNTTRSQARLRISLTGNQWKILAIFVFLRLLCINNCSSYFLKVKVKVYKTDTTHQFTCTNVKKINWRFLVIFCIFTLLTWFLISNSNSWLVHIKKNISVRIFVDMSTLLPRWGDIQCVFPAGVLIRELWLCLGW